MGTCRGSFAPSSEWSRSHPPAEFFSSSSQSPFELQIFGGGKKGKQRVIHLQARRRAGQRQQESLHDSDSHRAEGGEIDRPFHPFGNDHRLELPRDLLGGRDQCPAMPVLRAAV